MTMFTSNAPVRSSRLRDAAAAIVPRALVRYVSGLRAGYRGYLVYSELSAKSNAELAQRGLSRADVPEVALKTIRANTPA